MDPIISWVEMGRTAEAAANIDRYRHPLIPGRSDLGGRRRTSADKLLLSAGKVVRFRTDAGKRRSSEVASKGQFITAHPP